MRNDNLVISPVYNEENTIREFYRVLRKYYQGDVLFVDDGSDDGGKEYLAAIKDARTFVLRHPRRQGYGGALLSGFAFAVDKDYQSVITIDADLQHNPIQIPHFLRELREYGAVVGSRYIRIERFLNVPRERIIINKYVASAIKALYDVEFPDAFCGFRGYRVSFLKSAQLEEKSYGLALELLIEIIKTHTVYKEIPVEAVYRDNMRKFLDGLDEPRARLLHYLKTISRKKEKEFRCEEEEVFDSKPASR